MHWLHYIARIPGILGMFSLELTASPMIFLPRSHASFITRTIDIGPSVSRVSARVSAGSSTAPRSHLAPEHWMTSNTTFEICSARERYCPHHLVVVYNSIRLAEGSKRSWVPLLRRRYLEALVNGTRCLVVAGAIEVILRRFRSTSEMLWPILKFSLLLHLVWHSPHFLRR